jgi:hypothetical protein
VRYIIYFRLISEGEECLLDFFLCNCATDYIPTVGMYLADLLTSKQASKEGSCLLACQGQR